MPVQTAETHVVTRIGFAERWLHRARAHYAGGDATAGLRMLALADAEVRVALQTERWAVRPVPATRPARWTPWVLLAVAAVAAVWTLRPAGVPADAGAVDGPPIVRLSPTIGTLLSGVATAPARHASATVLAAGRRQHFGGQVARRAVTAVRSSAPRADRVSPTAKLAQTNAGPSPAQPAAGVATAGPSPSTGSSFVLSEVDLIDMVLAATQALRSTGP